jgi:iron complex outermembrane recepter protein
MKSLLKASSAFALIAASSAGWAQEAEDDGAGNAEIIVTAQKREEKLQDVPVAVSVLGGEKLAAQGGVNLETAQSLIPTLNIQKSGTTLNQSLFMRGVGTATFSIAGEPSVSTVVDGVVLSRSGEAFSELVDIERIEILRGPQGSLFGKNASAGVINIVTKRPGDNLGGSAEASFFTKSEFRGRVALDLPLSDTIKSRLTGFYSEYDGNIRNTTLNTTVNGYKRYGIRGVLVADVSDGAKFTLIADWRKSKDDCCAQLIGTVGTGQAFQILPTPRGDKTRTVTQNLISSTEETSYGVSLQGDIDIGDHTLTTISAYRNWKNTETRDGDWLPQAYIGLTQLHDVGPQTGNTISQELRIASPTGGFLDYIVGAYYSRAESDRVFARSSILCSALTAPAPTTATPCTSPLAAPSRTPLGIASFGSTFKNLAFFANGTLNFTDRMRGIVGLRYTIDRLAVYHQRVSVGLDVNGSGQPVNTGGSNVNFGPFAASTKNEELSGRVGMQFELSDASTSYFTYTRGYKGPAYNIFFNLGATGTNVIEAETSNALEVGLKNTLMGGDLVLNIAAFYAKYNNFQANNPDLIPGNPPTVVSRFTNAGKVSTRGVEIDLIAKPTDGLTISGGLAYTDAKVDQFKLPPGGNPADVIPSGTPLLFAPKWKGSLGADYRTGLSEGMDLFLGVQTSFQSKQLSIFSPNAALRALGTIGGYGLVNLSAGVGDKDDKYRITFQVRNLFDNSFAAFLESGGPGGSIRYQIPREADRYFGVTAKINFGG